MEKTPVISGFAGENTDSPAVLLPPNVSPRGLNNDYLQGTAKQRAGIINSGMNPIETLDRPIRILGVIEAVKDVDSQPDSALFVYEDTGLQVDSYSGGLTTNLLDISANTALTYADSTVADANSIFTVSSTTAGDCGLYRYNGTNVYVSSPDQFDNTGVLASGSGAGAFNGTYLYKFAWRSSTEGTESELSGAVTCVATNDAQLDISVLPTTAPTNTGVDKIRIYRTITGGATYYYLADHTIGTPTYTDTTTDGNLQLNARMDEYRGKAPNSGIECVGFWQDRVWVGYRTGELLYTEKTANDLTIDSMAVWSRFYAENFVLTTQGVRSDVVRKLVPISPSQMLVVKDKSIDMLYGSGPGTYACINVTSGIGASSPSLVVQAPDGVYFANPDNIFFMAGGASLPVPLLRSNYLEYWRAFDTVSTPRHFQYSCMTYEPTSGRLFVCPEPSSRSGFDDNEADLSKETLVYDSLSKAWAKWTIGFDSFAPVSYSANGIVGAVRGRIAGLSQNNPYDVQALIGTVTSATTTSVTATFGGTPSKWSNMLVVTAAGDTQLVTINGVGASVSTVETLDPVPAAGDLVYVGAIEWLYQTPPLSLSGDRSSYDAVKRVWAFFRNPELNTKCTVEHVADGVTSATHVFDASNRVSTPTLTMTNARAREHYFIFSNRFALPEDLNPVWPTYRMELEGYQIGFIRERSHDGN